jgi:hypothetical protein
MLRFSKHSEAFFRTCELSDFRDNNFGRAREAVN